MFDKLEILQMARGMVAQASARHSVIARNIAHADTPGYHARDIASFADTYRVDTGRTMRATRARHLSAASGSGRAFVSFETDDPTSPNGNSVSLETEMVKASEVQYQHELALSIYSTSLGILRTSLGRR